MKKIIALLLTLAMLLSLVACGSSVDGSKFCPNCGSKLG